MHDHYQIFCACCLWPWLGPPLKLFRYVMYFFFVDDIMFFLQWAEFSYEGPISLKFTCLLQHRTEFSFILLKGIILTISKLVAN